jgi:hypothetical protein
MSKSIDRLEEARVKVTSTDIVEFDTLNVMPAKCATCPWRSDGGILDDQPELKAQLAISVLSDSSQYCHAPAFKGMAETRVCRGSRDHQIEFFYNCGFLNEATDECWEAKWVEMQQGRA